MKYFWSVFFVSFLVSCSTTQQPVEQINEGLPYVEREFRAAWVATVANINWPSRPGLPVDSQKIEALALLDLMQSMNFNAVIFQVRPQADALYKSDLEPWSYFLTGEQGKAPEPFYDPLEFWIQESHKRGMDLHAWINPYRVHHFQGGEVSNESIAKKHPEAVVKLDAGYYWFEPTHPFTQDHTYKVVLDLVNRYDLDGIHMDDYFYPYPSYHNSDFPDDASYQAYLSKGGKLSKGDWRRDAVNQFIARLYQGIKNEKSWVQFGISPFGIWRPGYPQSIQGFDQYDKLYADARLWLEKGWLDYFAPQLYWPINQIPQSFPVLLGWWQQVNLKHRHLWPGVSVGRFEGEKMIDETINQIMITRGMLPDSPGLIHWSIAPHTKNPELVEALKNGPYQKKALIPASPWLDKMAPQPPRMEQTTEMGNKIVKWQSDETQLSRVVVFTKYDDTWKYDIFPADQTELTFPLQKEKLIDVTDGDSTYTVSKFEILNDLKIAIVDKAGNMSKTEK